MDKEIKNQFNNPGSAYRGAPFWAWNGKLDPPELQRQIRIMHRMGLGGFFMHSRVGLDTAYLSDEWFRCINACVEEAEKLNMRPWLYDEDRWPSGAGGGYVTSNPEYRRRSLIVEEIGKNSAPPRGCSVLALFSAELDGGTIRNVQRINGRKMPVSRVKGRKILRFLVKVDECTSWYNGQTYLDTMNPAAVKRFIQVTHETYKKKTGPLFGKVIPGIFTDEPNFGRAYRKKGTGLSSVPWTDRLPETFKKRYGYDLTDHLPEIFWDVEGTPLNTVRYHYFDCLTHLFVKAFAEQIGAWCGKNNLLHTGHVLHEETLSDQSRSAGSAMRFYEHMQAPGIDILTEHSREYDTAKQVSSVARQFERKWRLSETYGCTGWDFSFAGHKAVSDWQAALGINLRCQHLAWYTMEGQAKRDYPASIFHQSPWWETYSRVEDYFARVNLVMTRGREVRDLLVIHPVESMWTLLGINADNDPAVAEYDKMLISLRDSLCAKNIDFDYGEEEIMSRHGSAGKKNGAPVFRVGKAEYKAVLVPPLKTIRSTTLELLHKFREAGGTVIFAGNIPEHVDAVISSSAAQLAETCVTVPHTGKKLITAVEQNARRISIKDGSNSEIAPALYLLREDRDASYLFVCNTGHLDRQLKPRINDNSMVRERRADFPEVKISGFENCRGIPMELDADTGRIYRADFSNKNGKIEIRTNLPPLGSRLFVIPRKKRKTVYPPRKQLRTVRSRKLGGSLKIALSEANNLVLDRPRWKIGKGRFNSACEILRVDNRVRDELGIAGRGGRMMQPWARKTSGPGSSVEVTLSYGFEALARPSGPIYLAIERPETFTAEINGHNISMDTDCGWWCDRSLRKIPVNPSFISPGKNSIVLTCNYNSDHPGLEIVYLLGNFGVRTAGTDLSLTKLPEKLAPGDWTKKGFPFYSGSISYRRSMTVRHEKDERVFLELPDYRGTAVRVCINAQEAGIIAWDPAELDITDLIDGAEARFELEMEVIGHRRNSHGPLHHTEKWPRWTGSGAFVTSGGSWQEGFNLVPCGLIKPARISIRKP